MSCTSMPRALDTTLASSTESVLLRSADTYGCCQPSNSGPGSCIQESHSISHLSSESMVTCAPQCPSSAHHARMTGPACARPQHPLQCTLAKRAFYTWSSETCTEHTRRSEQPQCASFFPCTCIHASDEVQQRAAAAPPVQLMRAFPMYADSILSHRAGLQTRAAVTKVTHLPSHRGTLAPQRSAPENTECPGGPTNMRSHGW